MRQALVSKKVYFHSAKEARLLFDNGSTVGAGLHASGGPMFLQSKTNYTSCWILIATRYGHAYIDLILYYKLLLWRPSLHVSCGAAHLTIAWLVPPFLTSHLRASRPRYSCSVPIISQLIDTFGSVKSTRYSWNSFVVQYSSLKCLILTPIYSLHFLTDFLPCSTHFPRIKGLSHNAWWDVLF